MIKEICNNIKALILSEKYHLSVYEMVELVTVTGEEYSTTQPKYYVGDGNLKEILDFEGNMAYVRKTGPLSFYRDLTMDSTTSNLNIKDTLKISIPLRVVSIIDRKDFTCDDNFTDDFHIMMISNVINGNQEGLPADINALKVIHEIKTATSKREDIWETETSGIPYRVLESQSIVSIDFIVDLTIKSDCLNLLCEY